MPKASPPPTPSVCNNEEGREEICLKLLRYSAFPSLAMTIEEREAKHGHVPRRELFRASQ